VVSFSTTIFDISKTKDMTTATKEYQKKMKEFIQIEKKVEELDRKNDPEADILRRDLDDIQAILCELSAIMETE
jgi:hypothetical protein